MTMKTGRILIIFLAAALPIAGCSVNDPVISYGPDVPAEREYPFGYNPDGDNDGLLPCLCIDTPSPVSSKETWVTGADIRMMFPNGQVQELGKTKIKLRGNSTLHYPKKSYNIKLEESASLIGIRENKSWCLLAQWMDRTLLRNDVAFEIARRTDGLDWTPKGEFVELRLNGKMSGTYYLCEKIKASKERVPVAECGYILELDTNYDEAWKFHSAGLNLPVMVKEPDEDDMNEEIFLTIKDEYNRAESYVTTSNHKVYGSAVDIDSYIDWLFVHELCCNYEPTHPKSAYMHRAPDGLLHAGPVWDFDWGTFTSKAETTRPLFSSLWFGYLMADPVFVSRLKEKWTRELPNFLEIPDYILRRAAHLEKAADTNFCQWPITQNVNHDESLSFAEAVKRMKANYEQRVWALDVFISGL